MVLRAREGSRQHRDDRSGPEALGVHAKKKSLVASERHRPEIQAWRCKYLSRVLAIEASRFVFIDESGAHIAMTREYARGRSGVRVGARIPRNRGTVLTMIAALSLTGVRALMTVVGATTKEVFRTFLEKHLLPILNPGDVVVWDGLAAHKAKGMRELVWSVGAEVILLPAYSPDLNPIEECWSKVKSLLRTAAMRTVEALTVAAHYAVREVSEADARGWFSHSGYETQPK